MNTVLYFSTTGVAYETRAFTRADISALVADHGLESLTSADRQFDFWFAPTGRRCQQRVNHSATEMLLATTRFSARTCRCCVAPWWSPPTIPRVNSTA